MAKVTITPMEEKMLPFMSQAKKIKHFNLFQERLNFKECKVLTFHEEIDLFNAFELLAVCNGYTWEEQVRRLMRALIDGDIVDTGKVGM